MAQDRSVCRVLKEVYVQQWTSFGGYDDDDEDSTRYYLELEPYQIFIYTLLCQIPIFAGYCRYLIVNRY